MPRVRLPPVRHPCERCKARHVKCDDDSASCRRCTKHGVECARRPKETRFLPGSSARYDERFAGQYTWVGTGNQMLVTAGDPPEWQHNRQTASVQSSPIPADGIVDQPHTRAVTAPSVADADTLCHSCPDPRQVQVNDRVVSPVGLLYKPNNREAVQYASPWSQIGRLGDNSSLIAAQPLDPTQACLLKHFIDHIAPWLDTCDERNHFQLFVPVWARQYPPLLSAICATASRHLYRTTCTDSTDVKYNGQSLEGLTANTCVEHMLNCIPALRSFHEDHDEVHRNLIVAAAIVLRQYEEMEEEDGTSSGVAELTSTDVAIGGTFRVNFLDIINAIIRDSHNEGNFHRHELLDVAYWICLRQEVYSAFTQQRVPQMLLAPEQWTNASTVNKTVMHTAQVAKWLFEDRSLEEWGMYFLHTLRAITNKLPSDRLGEQQHQLELTIAAQTRFMPILKRSPEKARGEVFPTVWYGSDLVVIGVQHMLIAKMVLTAEAPGLASARDRGKHRKAEAEVRDIVLELCGTAMHRPACPPALVNAIMAILLYGEFFTDDWERQALTGLIERFRGMRAWPLPNGLRHSAQEPK